MPVTSIRKAKLGTLHALKRDTGLDDDAYRGKLELVTGHRSARDCTDAELDRAIAAFNPAPGMFHTKQSANNAYTRKALALYLAAANLGAFDSVTDAAFAAFVERQTGKHPRFLTAGEANAVSEALKAICSRHGCVVPANDPGGVEGRMALLRAQWKRLAEMGAVTIADEDALHAWASKHFLRFRGGIEHLKPEQADAAAKRLGSWIRKAQKDRPGP
jgi:phage gp16-like protein